MFHVVFLVKKRTDLSLAEFARYWIDDHTPLTTKAPGVLSYRCYPMTGHDGAPPPFEAIATLGFADESAWRRAEASPEFAAAVADAANFQETAATRAFYADEHIIV